MKLRREGFSFNSFCFLLACFVFVLLLSANSAAAIETPGQIEDIKEGIDKVQDIKEDIETAGTDFLLEQWKAYFLKLPVVAQIDSFFQKANVLFVILLSRNYELSIELFFAVILWLITFASLLGYSNGFYFIKESWLKILFALALSIIISQIQLINYFSKALVNLIFYPSAWYWKIITAIIAMAIIAVYYYANKLLSNYYIAGRKAREAREQKFDIQKTKAELKGIAKGMK